LIMEVEGGLLRKCRLSSKTDGYDGEEYADGEKPYGHSVQQRGPPRENPFL